MFGLLSPTAPRSCQTQHVPHCHLVVFFSRSHPRGVLALTLSAPPPPRSVLITDTCNYLFIPELRETKETFQSET